MIGQRTSLVGVPVLLLVGGLAACGGSQPVQLPPQSLNQAVERGYGDDDLAGTEGGDDHVLEADAASGREEENQENQEDSESKVPVGEVASAAPEPSAASAEQPRPRDATLVVIGEDEDDTPASGNPLLAASMAERQRRRTAPAAVAVINDKNLAEFAEGGNLTYTDKQPASTEEIESSAGEQARAEEELYWRTRVRSLRAAWRENADLVVELEQKAEGLRRDFYAEDDPYVRDRRIKPEWDRTLDRLEEARRGVERNREDLLTALEEGRRAGALAGWLRDGVELEPTPVTREEMPEVDPEEPKVIDP